MTYLKEKIDFSRANITEFDTRVEHIRVKLSDNSSDDLFRAFYVLFSGSVVKAFSRLIIFSTSMPGEMPARKTSLGSL